MSKNLSEYYIQLGTSIMFVPFAIALYITSNSYSKDKDIDKVIYSLLGVKIRKKFYVNFAKILGIAMIIFTIYAVISSIFEIVKYRSNI